MKVKLFVFIFSYIFQKSRGLERLAPEENNIILVTEFVIRNITNSLFIGLKFKSKKQNPKLIQSSLVHNFFTNVTLKDHKTLNEVVRLTRTDKSNINNETQHFMVVLNEILNEDSIEPNEDIIQYVGEFLSNLQGFKESSGYNDNYDNLDIKDEIINILRSGIPDHSNVSQVNETEAENLGKESLLSDNEFWMPEPNTRRIYRGDRTKIKYFPFMASIQVFNNFQCAGSIITSDLVITAASCLQLAWNNRFFRENPAFLSVRVGSNFYNGGGENIPVLNVYFYPVYNPRNLKHNIVVLRLLRHLKFRKHKRRMKKIDFDRHDSALPMTTDGITIVGWGARGSSNIVRDPWSNQLAFAVLDVYDLMECQEIYSKEYVTKMNFCAGFISKGGGACNHDVGGPGVVNGILTGVVSFGSPVCGAPDAPTVFTKVGYYADWIEEIMEEEPPVSMKRTTSARELLPFTDPLKPFKPTTFKIPPVGGKKMKPIPINQDHLRILDEDLFKDFLYTMFGSEEAKEFKDLLNENPVNKAKDEGFEQLQINKTEIQSEQMPEDKETYESADYDEDDRVIEEPVTLPITATKMSIYASNKLYSVADEMADENKVNEEDGGEVKIQNNIERLIENIDSSDAGTPAGNDKKSEEEMELVAQATTEKTRRKKKDKDRVMTLLYISDSEKANTTLEDIGNVIQDFDDNFDDGINIAMDGFKDLTFRNNVTNSNSMLDFMTKNELYDLISEAIDDVTKNKSIAR